MNDEAVEVVIPEYQLELFGRQEAKKLLTMAKQEVVLWRRLADVRAAIIDRALTSKELTGEMVIALWDTPEALGIPTGATWRENLRGG